jgi:cephalosporin-C deacetylase-like acetyl esterase
LARLVCQWYDSAVVRERLAEKLNRQVSDLASTYIGALCLDDELELDELVLPINPPTVKNVSVHGASQSGSFVSFAAACSNPLSLKFSYSLPCLICDSIPEFKFQLKAARVSSSN